MRARQRGIVETDREQALAALDIHGFTVVRGVLDAGQVTAMKAALMRCEREVGTDHRHHGRRAVLGGRQRLLARLADL